MDYKNFGIYILLYRRQNRLNQTDFAARAGISRNYLSMIERNEAHNVSVDILVRLAEAMKIEPVELFKILRNENSAADDNKMPLLSQ